MNNQEKIKNIANQIVKNYKPEKIILFGSFAYGAPKPSSDVDLLVVKNSRKKRVERIKDLLMAIESDLPVEPLAYTAKELKKRLDMGDFFFHDIISKGKVLYEK
ncbi:MAG: nucleotidyltransferase domain-containing protein [Patescibacteria group bacterium]